MRETRQYDAVQAFLDSDGKTIINAAPRFGKIKVAIDIMTARGYRNPIIAAPRKDIFAGWESDFKKWKYHGTPTFTTFVSLKKMVETAHMSDFFIIDEPHEMSLNQQKVAGQIVKDLPTLGLTGTMTDKTAIQLYDNLGLDTCYKYTIEQAVDEGILTDYQIYIHRIPLDNKRLVYKSAKGKSYTEKGYFDLYMYVREKSKDKFFLDTKLINIIQNSHSKAEETRRLISRHSLERILVFCGTTQIADSLGIPVYHSKSREKDIFNAFCKGEKYNQLATIKMMQAGITILPINKGIINYTSGSPEDSTQKICRFLGFEYGNPDKKAEIHIISSDERFEQNRLKTALSFFDPKKIQLCV